MSAPVDLEGIARDLDADIRAAEGRHSSLRREKGKWVVRVDGDHALSAPNGRFAIAHELAHILFTMAGMRSPISSEEYWLLEEACDRVARCLLVPMKDYSFDVLAATEARRRFNVMVDDWLLRNRDAAMVVAQHALNCKFAVVLHDVHGFGSPDWIVDNARPGDRSSWSEGVGIRLDLLDELFNLHEGMLDPARPGHRLVSVIRRRRENPNQMRLPLLDDTGGSDVEMVIVYCLEEPEDHRQMRLPI